VSLNPLRHLDPFGTVLLVLVGIGWGKPVPVRVQALRSGRTGMALVSAAGPVANVVVAVALAATYRLIDLAGLGGPVVLQVLYVGVAVNLLLAILNLIPIPPLDGFGVVISLVPPHWEYTIRPYAGYGVVLLLLLLILPNSPLQAVLGLAYPWAALLCGI
jgi:Zn-dependent protease